MPFSEDDLIPISALQHVLFCERQYALIHLEQIWAENQFTAEGKVLHERVHVEHHESRRLFRQEYDMAVRSLELGLIGKCDLVELWLSDDGGVKRVSPVEFKRGREKENDVDRVQICAQALCLEEMFRTEVRGMVIETGQLYYLQEHRRSDVILDAELRKKTCDLINRIRTIEEAGITPAADYDKRKCDRCSLADICMPRSTGAESKRVDAFIKNQLRLVKQTCAAEKNES
ncbi:CRISPR-associated protein Cas4 [Spirochaetia bacterium]|nr:CRISPR-associated protein Cas4 [Spirochaetia bacterium]